MGNSMENKFTDVRIQRVAIASSKHKVSHSATLCFSYTSASSSVSF